MNYGFVKVASATPVIRVADCESNANNIITQINEAYSKGAVLVNFPELCVTGYTCSDLFLQKTLIDSAENAVKKIMDETKALEIIAIVGVPVPVRHSLYNCAVVIYKGEILGIVPKVNIPDYAEYNEMRYFSSGKALNENITYAECENIPFSDNIIFECKSMPELCFGVEVCEDLWVAQSPSVNLALSGATIICNNSASGEAVSKENYRRDLVKMQSGKLCCAYVYSDSGFGESTTDMVFSAHNIISENYAVLAETERFSTGLTYAEIDVQKLISERKRNNLFIHNIDNRAKIIEFNMHIKHTKLERCINPLPFIPIDKYELAKRCENILNIQATGLTTRLAHTGIRNVVLGLSGGLDSTLALIVCVYAFDMLGIDRKNIHTVTMPCFGTTKRTKSNAEKLALAYGVSFEEINITASVRQHFVDIGHDESVTNVTYENSQARERTQILMDLSNKYSGLVIGTGDLSELALGWATYNGDHMSMYAVNASVPKTLVRHLTAYEADKAEGEIKAVLCDVLNTPVSPELLPPDKNGEIAQKTEDLVGPYELHDFFLYYLVRFGFTPCKIYYLAKVAFKGVYDNMVIKKWLTVFVKRFFTQQFKRSCMPDGPKIGTVTLSPRSDWKMPSDAAVRVWLDDLKNAED